MQYLFSIMLLCFLSLLAIRQDTPESLPKPKAPMTGIRTQKGYSTESLVRDIFAKGTCDNISNIRSIGNSNGIGYFENGENTIGMERGIVIATGPIEHAEGPNQVGDKSGALGNAVGDADLGMFIDERVLDVVGIEFDFVPLDSFVTFRYVFASEEYCEFVGSVYNDVFGFFVSGPGIQGEFSRRAKNVALIPGTNDYVAINSVNHAYNSQYFIRNELERDSRQCGIDPYISPHRNNIEYDGFTTILTAALQLIPCETYHIRLVVADVADRFYDSAVFLEAESFNIGGKVLLNAEAKDANKATEGCQNAYFVFERDEKENQEKPLTVQFKISNESTAIEGVDFEPIPRKITIPARASKVRLPVKIINDGLTERDETLKIELDIPCACYSGSATLILTDPPPMHVNLSDLNACRNGIVRLVPEVNGGIPPYSYRWSNGGLTSTLEVAAGTARTYAVTVSDNCGNSAMDSCTITVIEPPSATLQGFMKICTGDTTFLPVSLEGLPPWSILYTIDDVPQPIIENIWDASYLLPATQDGIYKIKIVSDANCEGTTEGYGEIEVVAINIDQEVQDVSCFAGSDGRITVKPISGVPPYEYRWAQSTSNEASQNGLSAGEYSLSVTDAMGCEGTFSIELAEPSPLSPVIFDCEDLTDSSFEFVAKGGTAPYYYSIDGENYHDQSLFQQLIPGVTYELTTRDANGCELAQSFTLPPRYERMVELPNIIKIKIGETYELKPLLNISENFIANIRWLSSNDLSCIDCLNPETEALSEGSYTIRVTDVFGCTGEATVQIKLDRNVDVFIPTAFSPDYDGVNDRFVVYANERQVSRVISFQVFDRWGNQLYEAHDFAPNDESKGWDGRIGKQIPNAGVFVYIATLELVDGSEATRKGQVLLVR
ncbi:MAG: choice-of-anchor L domain-containing protein [Saprospiraceae bacterium]|nr:choice-of-anchor L domain-containing protein [Saprospiraceae bacterium]